MESQKHPGLDQVMAGFVRSLREDCVKKLLAGNDAGCFSTEQYKEFYQKSTWGSNALPMTNDVAEMHLRGLPELVREVRPGVWAAAGSTSEHNAPPRQDSSP